MRMFGHALKGLMGRWRRGKPTTAKLPSLVRAMDDLVPRKVMREVVASSHDRRQWGVLAAAWVGVSEREFFSAAARAMGISFEERIVAPDLSIFGSQARAMLAELRRLGAIVVLDNHGVSRIVAVDPAEIRGLSLYESHMDVALASWSDIARALDAAERLIVESENNSEHREAKRRQEVCGKILNIIIREAAAHGAQSVEVVTSDGRTRYQFSTSHGRTATGAIRPEVVHELLKYLCSVEGSVIKTEAQGDVVLRSLGSASNFRLAWGLNAASRSEVRSSLQRADVVISRPRTVSNVEASRAVDAVSEEYLAHGLLDEPPVLVVDDNPMFCRVLERLLRREGLHPYFAENGVVALEKLEAAKNVLPKVIICDVHMPIMNGRELLHRLKSDTHLRSIPVIMLTSDEDIDGELQLLAGGAEAFVSKAKDPRVLITQVRRLLKNGILVKAA